MHHSLEDSNACVLVVTWEDGQLDTITITNGYRLISAVFLRLQWYRHKEGKLWSSGWRDIQSRTVWMPFTMYLTNSEIDWRYTPVFVLNIFFFFFNLASIVLLTRLPELVWDLYFILGLLFGLNLATLGRRQESEVGFKNKGLWSPCVLYFVRTRSFKNDVMLWRAENKQFAPRWVSIPSKG